MIVFRSPNNKRYYSSKLMNTILIVYQLCIPSLFLRIFKDKDEIECGLLRWSQRPALLSTRAVSTLTLQQIAESL